MLDCQRHRFRLPPDVHYLNGAYMSPLMAEVEDAGIEGIRRKRFPGDIAARDFFADADALRRRFATLLGADEPGRVAILPAVSYGVSVAARNAGLAPGRNVVLTGGQFPSNALVWRRLASEHGADLRAIEPPTALAGRGVEWNARVLDAIDADTAAVALPPVHWTDGSRFDLRAVGDRCRDVGAALVIDATQSLGAVPFDLAAVRPDAVIAATYKWLLGPYSLALGWFGPRFDGGTPLEETWLAREGSDDFRDLVRYAEAYRPMAARYDVGGRSNFILLPMAIAALDRILDWTPAAVESYSRRIADGLFEPLLEHGYDADDERGRGAHLFGLRPPDHVDMAALQRELRTRRIHVSLRGAVVRVSAHVYNHENDLAALRDALVAAAAGVNA